MSAGRCYRIGNTARPGGIIRIITESRLSAFWKEHADAETPLKEWRRQMRLKQYRTPHEVRADFSTADFLKNGVTVFNVGGNKYRLVVTMRYDMYRSSLNAHGHRHP